MALITGQTQFGVGGKGHTMYRISGQFWTLFRCFQVTASLGQKKNKVAKCTSSRLDAVHVLRKTKAFLRVKKVKKNT